MEETTTKQEQKQEQTKRKPGRPPTLTGSVRIGPFWIAGPDAAFLATLSPNRSAAFRKAIKLARRVLQGENSTEPGEISTKS